MTWALGHCPGPVDNFGQTWEKVPDAIDEPDFRNSYCGQVGSAHPKFDDIIITNHDVWIILGCTKCVNASTDHLRVTTFVAFRLSVVLL